MENYRKKFEEYYKIKIPKGYVIHHIDCNHKNNDIGNLLLLPSKLHSQYHCYTNNLKSYEIPTIITGNFITENSYILNLLEKYTKVLKECNNWYDFKLYLDGKIPNIHYFELEKE